MNMMTADDRQFSLIHVLAEVVLLTASALVMHCIVYHNLTQDHYGFIMQRGVNTV
jgi:hypothetical protein